MKDLIEFIAKSLVEKPDEIVISEEEAEDGTVLVKLLIENETQEIRAGASCLLNI